MTYQKLLISITIKIGGMRIERDSITTCFTITTESRSTSLSPAGKHSSARFIVALGAVPYVLRFASMELLVACERQRAAVRDKSSASCKTENCVCGGCRQENMHDF